MRQTAFIIIAAAMTFGGVETLAQGDPHPGKQSAPLVRSGPPAKGLGDANGNFTGRSGGNGKVGFLTPQQQAMLSHEPGGQAQLNKLRTMSENDSLKLQTSLQKKWDNLPQSEKAKLQKQMANTVTQQRSR